MPLSEGGSNDIRNGIVLSQTLHWAFDRGLFGVLANRTIYVPRRIKAMPENVFVKQLEGRAILEARSSKLRVHRAALEWHLENCVRRWD